MLRHSAILLSSAAARVSRSSHSPLFRSSSHLQSSSSTSTSILFHVRSHYASAWSPFSVPAEAQEQHKDLPTIQIAKDASSVTIVPPKGFKYYRPEQPTTTLNPIWLRDNCPCPLCIHPSTRQKLHASSQVPLDISVSSVQVYPEGLELTWSKRLEDIGEWEEPAKARPGHKSLYSWDMILGSYGGTPSEHRQQIRMNFDPILWHEKRMQDKVLWIDYEEYMTTREGLYKGLKQLQEYGLFFLRGVPTEDDQVATVAERIGHLRHTFYGRTWDVKSVPNAKNIAYTNLNLGLHMDLLYMEAPPGLQLLHSLENSVPGGTSIFMDSFKAVELLKREHPEDFEILTRTPTTFHYRNGDHHLHYNRPTIALDHMNDTLTVNYAPPFQGPVELPLEQTQGFYRALKRFARYIERADLQFRHTMRPGECMVFANRRVLHARTAFDPSKGNRHLKGCYVDLDMFKDKFRTSVQAKVKGEC